MSKVAIFLDDREEGGLFVYSDDVPGLILSGSDKEAVGRCIVPAIEALRAHTAALKTLCDAKS